MGRIVVSWLNREKRAGSNASIGVDQRKGVTGSGDEKAGNKELHTYPQSAVGQRHAKLAGLLVVPSRVIHAS